MKRKFPAGIKKEKEEKVKTNPQDLIMEKLLNVIKWKNI